jgi:hypothetical protein
MNYDKKSYIIWKIRLAQWNGGILSFIFQILFFKCYSLIKWVHFKIFNQTSTHIIPNFKVGP